MDYNFSNVHCSELQYGMKMINDYDSWKYDIENATIALFNHSKSRYRITVFLIHKKLLHNFFGGQKITAKIS